jgi:tripartite-type tricarboxylate transporter receptor subunit TctC
MRFFLTVLTVATVLLIGCRPHDAALDDRSFYQSNMLEVIVPYGPGGGADTWTRMIAPHFQRALGSGAAVQVVNVPGASSVAGANDFALRRRADGRTALVSSSSTFLAFLLGEPMVRYDFAKLAPILASPGGGVVFASPTLVASSAADLVNSPAELVYGGISAAGNDLLPILAFELLGLDVRAVLGYSSKGATRLAFEQGETNVEYQTMPAYLTNVLQLVERGDAVPLFSFGVLGEDGTVVRDPAVPRLPTTRDAYVEIHGAEPDGVIWSVYRSVLAAGVSMAKVMWLHGDAPPRAIDELRLAAATMAADSAFLLQARREIGDYALLVGEAIDVQREVASQLAPEAREWIAEFLRERFDIDRLGGR